MIINEQFYRYMFAQEENCTARKALDLAGVTIYSIKLKFSPSTANPKIICQ